MSIKQNYGIKYPFQSDNNDELYLDLNETYLDSIKSQIFHVLFTPKGQKIRDPKFGSDLMKYLFEPNDDMTFNALKSSLTSDISAYVPNVIFKDISILDDEENEHSKIISVNYSVKMGNKEIETNAAIKI